MMKRLRILVADDHWVVRAALINLLPQLGEQLDVREASTGGDALQFVVNEPPFDLIIFDLQMPQTDPWETLSKLSEASEGTPIVVVSASERRSDVLNCLQRGASGYAPKSAEPEAIVSTFRRVLNGEVALPQRLLSTREADQGPMVLREDRTSGSVRAIAETLTRRQKQVFEMMGTEASNQEIADELGLSVNTVRVHLQAIARQLQLKSRAEIAAHAARIYGQ